MRLPGVMRNNKLIIAGAGSGKTTYLVKFALDNPSNRILITTYTEANEEEIKKTFIRLKGHIPANITIQTWFSFLLQHGVRPFQSELDESIHDKEIGFFLSSRKSGWKCGVDGKPILRKGSRRYWAEKKSFKNFYFNNSFRIYSDKISKFVISCNSATKGDVVNRITRIFDCVLVDEVQDLAGYDLELVKLLFQSDSGVLLVGDPRQVTYLTHHSPKYKKYANGNIKDFVEKELGKKTICEVDDTTLSSSHRNHQAICNLSNKLYPALPAVQPCSCNGCRSEARFHEGIFVINREEIDEYIRLFQPTQLRWNQNAVCNEGCPVMNFGEAKGLSFDRVLIYPTSDMKRWLANHNHSLKDATRAKLYVAITRARYSVTFVLEVDQARPLEGISRLRFNGGSREPTKNPSELPPSG